jgi:hypothetical protein
MERQQRVQRSKRTGQPNPRRLSIAVTGGNAKYTADQQKFRHNKMPRQGRETSPSAAALVVAWVDALPRSSAPRRRAGPLGSHQSDLHMNAIVSPIPTKAYKPATVTPRQRSVMMLSGWSLICLPGTALLLGYYCPTHAHIEHAGGRKLFRFHVQKRTDGEMRTSRSLARARHRAVRAVSSLPPRNGPAHNNSLGHVSPQVCRTNKSAEV